MHIDTNIKLIQQCRNQKKSNSFSVKSALWFPSIFNSNNIPYTNRIKNFSSIIKIFSGDKHSALNCNAAGITLLRGECWPPALEKNLHFWKVLEASKKGMASKLFFKRIVYFIGSSPKQQFVIQK